MCRSCGIERALGVGRGIPEYEAKRHEEAFKNGGTLLSVHCDTSEQIDAAKSSLQETGAHDIASASESGSTDKSGGRETFGKLSTTDVSDDDAVVAGNTLPRR